MLKVFITTLLLFPSVSVATGPSHVPTAAELGKEVASMPMPKLHARIKARAAAYRLFAKTVQGFGLQDASAASQSLNGKKFAAIQKRQ